MSSVDLLAKLASFFPGDIRARGRDYFSRGRVRVIAGGESSMEATVRGTEKYDVSFDLHKNRLDAWCDCPYFDSVGACKHLWATLLAADQLRYLSRAATVTDLVLDCSDSFDGAVAGYSAATTVAKPQPVPSWKDALDGLSRSTNKEIWKWPDAREVMYCVDVPESRTARELVLWLGYRDRQQDGNYSSPRALSLRGSQLPQLPSAADRQILSSLLGGMQHFNWVAPATTTQLSNSYTVPHPLSEMVLRQASEADRLFLMKGKQPDTCTPIYWDGGEPWQFGLRFTRSEQTPGWSLNGILRRDEDGAEVRMAVSEPLLIAKGGFVFTEDKAMPLASGASMEWISHLRKSGPIEAPDSDRDEMLGTLLCSKGLPELEVSSELQYEVISPQPRPSLTIRGKESDLRNYYLCRAHLTFDYEGTLIRADDSRRGVFNASTRQLLQRNMPFETASREWLATLGLKYTPPSNWIGEAHWELSPTRLPQVVRALVDDGWRVEADGKLFRKPGAFRIGVSTGIDWFDLEGSVDYGGASAKLPQLLEALRKGETSILLGDGTFGMLPEEWLRRFGPLSRLGKEEDGQIRFHKHQAGLLDVLLAAQPEAHFDEEFARIRDELRRFQKIEPAPQPAGFQGQLRDYQREGLGWMGFLRRYRFGGCLADDMGVGKTAQVLALLETRRELRAGGEIPPSLVVVPRSLVFNWMQEAARFTPQLRVLDYTGVDRAAYDLAQFDVVLTTYGTLRRDALRLKDVTFDYIVLDEAQAVKNSSSESAKAVRLLRGSHRLAMSGTPIENHLGELWALFEFLNPGMLGAASVFKSATGRNVDEETRSMLAHALRPFLLRRTKEQVARELPPKSEQTIYCELEPAQRKLYNELRQHYRNALLKRVDSTGMAKSKMQVLEALLRLRQAACHPGLVDKQRTSESSAKIDVLLDQLREVTEEGHKALVFSQFTSLLTIVRRSLDKERIAYEYLDGQTYDRQSCVERFQNNPETRLFLISLKAGGLGLNLTAAEYVFLLDPWWNPAAEMQAVDRAHRIGQTRQVFAYRLIARDTVEEKVLELQMSKRDLAAAIISEDNSLIRELRREDLDLLLS
ncbi:MAG: SNF2 helicase associated domain-containing protein [Acidobacteria bacterium]|nr:SNF2 helicase associated domain-containing protein [Acidobacteriota bacterium]